MDTQIETLLEKIEERRLIGDGFSLIEAGTIMRLKKSLYERESFSVTGAPVLRGSSPVDMWYLVGTLAALREKATSESVAMLFGVSQPTVKSWISGLREQGGCVIEWTGRSKPILDRLLETKVIDKAIPQFIVHSPGIYDLRLFQPFEDITRLYYDLIQR